jgi:decaprenylphospho-beta-D-ribofuranose 2-oxidase
MSALTKLNTPAFGNLRSYGDACLNDGGDAIDMTRLDRMLSFDADTGILEVEAGATVGMIAKRFASQGWLPAVMPGTGFATIGGCIANDVHGKNHHHTGTFGAHVLSINLIVNGTAKTLSATKNKELFKATIGGLGQTGIITSAKIQLKPCQGDVITVTERRIEDFDSFIEALDGSKSTYTVGWIDATATGDVMGRGILEEAETNYGLVPDAKKARSVPFNAPNFALSAPIVRTFNKAYYNRVPSSGRTSVKPFTEFFFPLDKINAWNKLYGKTGFHQFQCVVPVDQVTALKAMADKIAYAGIASPLAVIKRMGPGQSGYMSFPMDGYTLAVDFPNRGRATHLIAELEAMTEAAGGRVYLAKDATLSAERLPAMYPDLKKFAAIINKHDPEGALETDLTRRLNIRNAT